jgi:hypothetical protein
VRFWQISTHFWLADASVGGGDGSIGLYREEKIGDENGQRDRPILTE